MNKEKNMKNTIRILSAGLMLLFMTPAAHAESALAWLPFGIEPGKPLPDKAKRKLSKDDFVYEGASTYRLSGKFEVGVKNGVVTDFTINAVKAEAEEQYSMPKRWARLGMRLCTATQKGSSLDTIRAMAQKKGGKYLEVKRSWNNFYDVLSFEVGDKYRYSLYFLERYVSNKGERFNSYFRPICKGGLNTITVDEAVGEEY